MGQDRAPNLDIVVTQTVYAGCALAFILVIALMVLRGRTSKTGLAILFCCLVSAAWAAATAVLANLPTASLALVESIRLSAWLLFAVALVTMPARSGIGRVWFIGALAFCGVAIVNDGRLFFDQSGPSGFDKSQLLMR